MIPPGNADYMFVQPGETLRFAELSGSGVVRHIWFGGGAGEAHYHRKVLLRIYRIYWDGEASPSVDVPLGDFFSVGHGAAGSYYSLPLSAFTT